MQKKTIPEIQEAVEILHELNSDPDVVAAYDHSLKIALKENSMLAHAQRIGKELGIAQGIEREKHNTVLNLHRANVDLNTIAVATQLSVLDIQKIISMYEKK